MMTGERSTAQARSRTRMRARAACTALLLVFPLFLTACRTQPSECDLAQKVVENQSSSGVGSPQADEAYRSLAQEWAAQGSPVDSKAQAAALAMLTARRNGNVLAYGTAKKSFDFYVNDHCGYDVSLAQLS